MLHLHLHLQGILDNPSRWGKVLALIGDDDLRADLNNKFESLKTGVER